MNPNPIEDRRPRNLDEAPEHLTLIQAAYALGLSRENILKLEANGLMPRRHLMQFGRARKFNRLELVAWVETHATAGELGS